MPAIARLTIALPSELAELLREAVASGEYASVSELVREALRLWRQGRPHPLLTGPRPLQAQQLREAETRVDELTQICQRSAVKTLWRCGESDREFAVEFLDAHHARPHGRLGLLKTELEFLFGPPVTLFDLQREDNPAVTDHILATRRHLYTAGT